MVPGLDPGVLKVVATVPGSLLGLSLSQFRLFPLLGLPCLGGPFGIGIPAEGAVKPVEDCRAGFYARVFLVPKVTGGWRPVFVLSVLNSFLAVTPFRMETVSSVLESMTEGEWMVSLDLEDAYFQVPIHPQSRRF